jgi:lysophospholipase L1-like esterase
MPPEPRVLSARSLLAFALLLAIGCTRAGEAAHPAPAPSSTPRAARNREPAAAPALRPEAPRTAALTRVALPLARFYAALHELAQHERRSHVRVLWFGDSHTAADFMTDAVREPLQSRFGAGGPGFVRIGIKNYRHAAARVASRGEWRKVPAEPSGTRRLAGAVYGLSGMGASAKSANASVSIELDTARAWARAALHWQFVYRLPRSDARFTLWGAGPSPRVLSKDTGLGRRSGLTVFELDSEGEVTLSLNTFVGGPELFGVFVEAHEPGVVLDTLGINGARVGTPLGWQEDAWVQEVKSREPVLAVLSYGTNEVGDRVPVSRYRQEYAELVGRLRSAGEMDCLLLGPTERLRDDWTTYPRVLEIEDAQRKIAEELSCGFFSLVGAMGGPGSFRRWAFAVPPLARKDRVHLTAAGYRVLGAALAEELLSSYTALYPEPQAASR